MGNGITGSVVASTVFTPQSAVPVAHAQSIQNLLAGNKWGGEIGTAADLTYSFTNYSSIFNYTTTGMYELKLMTTEQQTAAVNAMMAWSNVANITFSAVNETATTAGDIRFSATTASALLTTNEISAPNTASNGDIWIGPNNGGYNSAVAGSYSFDAFMHELGHALGLDHPHTSVIAPVSGEDQLKYSIMSYRAFNGDSATGDYGNTFFPTTPMLNDIAAIQYLYGANMNYKTGNDTYTWTNGQKIFETIWDAGGNDTIDASNQSAAVTINLNSGKWSTIGGTFWNGQAYVNDCLTIAYGAVIENAKGTSLNDTFIGNQANNVLDGGVGIDTAAFSGNVSNYIISKSADGSITVTDKTVNGDGIDTLLNMEQVKFLDTTIQSVDIPVGPPNNAPIVLAPISLSDVPEDSGVITITATQLLANASDIDGNTLSVVNLTTTAGTLVNHNNGTWTLTPAANYNGTITLNYGVSDGITSTATTATQVVTPVYDAPTVLAPVSLASVAEDSGAITIAAAQLLAHASDIDGNTLSVTNLTASAGDLVDNNNGTWTLSPALNYNGVITFNYGVSDGITSIATTATQVVTPVNDVPTSASATILANEDTTQVIALADFAFNDVDVGNTLSKVMITSLPTKGTLKLGTAVITAANKEISVADILAGKLTFIPAANSNGIGYSSFEFKVSDGAAYSVSANTVTIDVASANDAPAGSVKISGTIGEGQTLTASNTLSDVDGMGTITYQWLSNGVEIANATDSMYILTSNEIGKMISVRADYVDGGGTAESVSSSSTTAVIQTVFTGTFGADTMTGNKFNNTYIVNNIGDKVIESSSTGGIDTVNSSLATYTLGANVEKLTLIDFGISAIGNTLANTLIGNDGDNTLDGKAGADIMLGGAGNDTYYVDNVGDKVYETTTAISGIDAGGIDIVESTISYTLSDYFENLTLIGTSAIRATGNTLDNILTGNKGANVLDGGIGADTMTGELGNDTYIVDNFNDQVIETSTLATEIDTVKSSVHFTLGANLEKVILTGTSNINAMGNTLNNTLTGNSGANILDGGLGADKMIGGLGDDTYYVDNIKDIVTETSILKTEIDTVNSSITYTLGSNIENLTLIGTSNINATGNTLNNTLMGNDGNNILNGKGGNDILTGGLGNDIFVFNTVLNPTTNKDTISDFESGVDKIQLENAIFAKILTLGALSANNFVTVTGADGASDKNDYIIYHSDTGVLSYDADGNGSGTAVQFATLTGIPIISNADFVVV